MKANNSSSPAENPLASGEAGGGAASGGGAAAGAGGGAAGGGAAGGGANSSSPAENPLASGEAGESGALIETDLNGFQTTMASGAAAVFAFGAPWCRDCVMARPWLEQLAAEFAGRVGVFYIDVDECETARDALAIRHIPTIIFAANGAEQCARAVEPRSIEQLREGVNFLIKDAK